MLKLAPRAHLINFSIEVEAPMSFIKMSASCLCFKRTEPATLNVKRRTYLSE